MTRTRWQLHAGLALALICFTAGHAEAGGTVLAVEDDEVYVDLGAEDGIGVGSRLMLMHIVVAKDPVTGEALRDRFPLGRLTVLKTGEHLCVARAPKKLKHRVKVGDEIELASRQRRFVDPWKQKVEASRRAAALVRAGDELERAGRSDADGERQRAEARIAAVKEVRAYWNETLGKNPLARVAIWKRFLGQNPTSPFAGQVGSEIRSLRQQMTAEKRAAAQKRDPARRRVELRVARLAALESKLDTRGALALRAPARVYQGQSVPLAFTVLDPTSVDRAWLYYRRRGDKAYQRVALERDGDAYLRGAIPAEVVAPPGLEYFVEVATGDNAPVAAVGSQKHPHAIPVETSVEESAPDIDHRSRVTLLVNYVDFDGKLNEGFDQYFHGEVDFMYRFHEPIYAMRVGFGTLDGMGGPKDVIDDDPTDRCLDADGVYMCRRVSYNYAYTEVELRYSSNLAFMIRPQFGTGSIDSREDTDAGRCNRADSDDPDCDFFGGLGLRARVRFGEESRTNLTLGFGVTENVGTIFEATYTWSVISNVPVLLSAQVTDQPIPEDFGVRLIADVGWRALDWVYPSVRVSYQARDVDHSGLSGGLAANFDW